VKIPKIIIDELERWDLNYEFVDGGPHVKLYVDGRFIGIVPKGSKKDTMGGRGGMNIRGNIRRAARGIQGLRGG